MCSNEYTRHARYKGASAIPTLRHSHYAHHFRLLIFVLSQGAASTKREALCRSKISRHCLKDSLQSPKPTSIIRAALLAPANTNEFQVWHHIYTGAEPMRTPRHQLASDAAVHDGGRLTRLQAINLSAASLSLTTHSTAPERSLSNYRKT